MLICLDCGKILKNIKLDYSEESINNSEESINNVVTCPICESDNIWDEQLEMYVNDYGVL